MRWLTAINALGVLVGAAYTGFAISPSHAPLWGGLATLLFLVALFIPMAAEYISLGRGFKDVSDDFVEARQRERGLGPKVEILVDKPPARVFRTSGRATAWTVAVFLVASGLLIFDVVERQANRPPAPAKPGVISNF